MANSKGTAVWLKDVCKRYRLGKSEVSALKNISLSVTPGEFVALAGTSGSGKTTLLNLIGCVDIPTSGEVCINGVDVTQLSADQRAKFRSVKIGFVFQTFNLLPVLSARENVEYPLMLLDYAVHSRRALAEEALHKVGLEGLSRRRPDELSGGQRQRVAIARALVKKPALILADEPTANLDRVTAAGIVSLMKGLNRDGMTFLFSSHDPLILKEAGRVLPMVDGRRVKNEEFEASGFSLKIAA